MTKKNATKKTHPADMIDLAAIPTCKKFCATILKNNAMQTQEFPTLAAARIEKVKLDATANNGRKALIYGLAADGRTILIPDSYKEPGAPTGGSTPADQGIAAARQEAQERRDAKAAAKPGKPSKVAAPDEAAAKQEAAELAAHKAKSNGKGGKAEKPAKPAKAAKPEKPAKKAAAKKAADGKRDGSKVATVIAMLTGKKPVLRKAIVEATGWQVDLKALCARKGMKLKKHPDGTFSATPPKE
jgi:nucleoid-associated protein YgaU